MSSRRSSASSNTERTCGGRWATTWSATLSASRSDTRPTPGIRAPEEPLPFSAPSGAIRAAGSRLPSSNVTSRGGGPGGGAAAPVSSLGGRCRSNWVSSGTRAERSPSPSVVCFPAADPPVVVPAESAATDGAGAAPAGESAWSSRCSACRTLASCSTTRMSPGDSGLALSVPAASRAAAVGSSASTSPSRSTSACSSWNRGTAAGTDSFPAGAGCGADARGACRVAGAVSGAGGAVAGDGAGADATGTSAS